MFLPVVDILGGDAADQGVTRVAVRQQRADGEQHLRDGEGGAPLVLQDVQADHALRVDVAVVNPCPELHFWRLERVVRGKVDVEEEDPALVHGAGRPEDCRHPLVQVVPLWSRAAVGWRVQRDGPKLFLDSFSRRGQSLGHFRGPLLFFRLLWCITLTGRLRHF